MVMMGVKGGFGYVLWMHLNLVEHLVQIDFGKP